MKAVAFEPVRCVSASTAPRPAAPHGRTARHPATPATDDDDSRAATRCGEEGTFRTRVRVLSIPNNDGPIQTLQDGIGFGTDAQTVEFWPDGTASCRRWRHAAVADDSR